MEKMDVEKALRLTSSKELKKACMDAETHNVEIGIVNELYRRYYAACRKEEEAARYRAKA